MDELDQIGTLRGRVPQPSRSDVERALTRVLRGETPTPWHRQRVRRRWVAAAAVPLALALLVTGGLTLRDGGVVVALPPAQALEEAATAAAAQPDPGPLRPGQFWYVKSESTELQPRAEVEFERDPRPPYRAWWPVTRERWLAIDGSGRIRSVPDGDPEFVDPAGRARWEAEGRPWLGYNDLDQFLGTEAGEAPDEVSGQPSDAAFGSVGVDSYEALLRLPADPRALYRHFREQAERSRDRVPSAAGEISIEAETFGYITDLLGEAPTPPRVQAALYRAAALIPGVRVLSGVTDPAGRPSRAITMVDSEHRLQELYYDPETGAPLARSTKLTRQVAEIPAGTTVFEVVYLDRGVVASTSERID